MQVQPSTSTSRSSRLVGPGNPRLRKRLKEAEAQLKRARDDVKAQRALMARSLMSPAAYERAQLKLRGLEKKVTELEAKVAELRRTIALA